MKVNFLNLKDFLVNDKIHILYLDFKKINHITEYNLTISFFYENFLLSKKNYNTKDKLKVTLNKKYLLKGNYKVIFQIFGLNKNKEIMIYEEFKHEIIIDKIEKKKNFNQVGIIRDIINKI